MRKESLLSMAALAAVPVVSYADAPVSGLSDAASSMVKLAKGKESKVELGTFAPGKYLINIGQIADKTTVNGEAFDNTKGIEVELTAIGKIEITLKNADADDNVGKFRLTHIYDYTEVHDALMNKCTAILGRLNEAKNADKNDALKEDADALQVTLSAYQGLINALVNDGEGAYKVYSDEKLYNDPSELDKKLADAEKKVSQFEKDVKAADAKAAINALTRKLVDKDGKFVEEGSGIVAITNNNAENLKYWKTSGSYKTVRAKLSAIDAAVNAANAAIEAAVAAGTIESFDIDAQVQKIKTAVNDANAAIATANKDDAAYDTLLDNVAAATQNYTDASKAIQKQIGEDEGKVYSNAYAEALAELRVQINIINAVKEACGTDADHEGLTAVADKKVNPTKTNQDVQQEKLDGANTAIDNIETKYVGAIATLQGAYADAVDRVTSTAKGSTSLQAQLNAIDVENIGDQVFTEKVNGKDVKKTINQYVQEIQSEINKLAADVEAANKAYTLANTAILPEGANVFDLNTPEKKIQNLIDALSAKADIANNNFKANLAVVTIASDWADVKAEVNALASGDYKVAGRYANAEKAIEANIKKITEQVAKDIKNGKSTDISWMETVADIEEAIEDYQTQAHTTIDNYNHIVEAVANSNALVEELEAKGWILSVGYNGTTTTYADKIKELKDAIAKVEKDRKAAIVAGVDGDDIKDKNGNVTGKVDHVAKIAAIAKVLETLDIPQVDEDNEPILDEDDNQVVVTKYYVKKSIYDELTKEGQYDSDLAKYNKEIILTTANTTLAETWARYEAIKFTVYKATDYGMAAEELNKSLDVIKAEYAKITMDPKGTTYDNVPAATTAIANLAPVQAALDNITAELAELSKEAEAKLALYKEFKAAEKNANDWYAAVNLELNGGTKDKKDYAALEKINKDPSRDGEFGATSPLVTGYDAELAAIDKTIKDGVADESLASKMKSNNVGTYEDGEKVLDNKIISGTSSASSLDPTKDIIDVAPGVEFYLYNVEAGGYFTGGNNWGTHATVENNASKALKVRFTPAGDGKYRLEDWGNSKGSKWMNTMADADDSIYVDASNQDGQETWTFNKLSDGTFTISNSLRKGLLSAGETPANVEHGEVTGRDVIFSDAADAKNKWVAVADCSFGAAMPNIDKNSTTEKNISLKEGGTLLEAYAGWGSLEMTDFYVTKKVTLAKGMYKLTVPGFYRYGGGYDNSTTSNAWVIAGDKKVKLPNVVVTGAATDDEAWSAVKSGKCNTVIEFEVTEDNKVVEIGVKGSHDLMRSWCVIGGYTLEKASEVKEQKSLKEIIDDLKSRIMASRVDAQASTDNYNAKVEAEKYISEYGKTDKVAGKDVSTIISENVTDLTVVVYEKDSKGNDKKDSNGNRIVQLPAASGANLEYWTNYLNSTEEDANSCANKLQAIKDDIALYYGAKESEDAEHGRCMNAELAGIKARVDALVADIKSVPEKAKKDEAANKELVDKVTSVRKTYNEVYLKVSSKDESTQLQANLEKLTGYEKELDALDKAVTDAYKTGESDEIKSETMTALSTLAEKIKDVEKYLDSPEYVQNIAADNTQCYEDFLTQIAKTDEAYRDAVKLILALRNVETVDLSTLLDGAEGVEGANATIYNKYAQEILDLKNKAKEEKDATTAPDVYDIERNNIKAANQMTADIKAAADKLQKDADKLAKEWVDPVYEEKNSLYAGAVNAIKNVVEGEDVKDSKGKTAEQVKEETAKNALKDVKAILDAVNSAKGKTGYAQKVDADKENLAKIDGKIDADKETVAIADFSALLGTINKQYNDWKVALGKYQYTDGTTSQDGVDALDAKYEEIVVAVVEKEAIDQEEKTAFGNLTANKKELKNFRDTDGKGVYDEYTDKALNSPANLAAIKEMRDAVAKVQAKLDAAKAFNDQFVAVYQYSLISNSQANLDGISARIDECEETGSALVKPEGETKTNKDLILAEVNGILIADINSIYNTTLQNEYKYLNDQVDVLKAKYNEAVAADALDDAKKQELLDIIKALPGKISAVNTVWTNANSPSHKDYVADDPKTKDVNEHEVALAGTRTKVAEDYLKLENQIGNLLTEISELADAQATANAYAELLQTIDTWKAKLNNFPWHDRTLAEFGEQVDAVNATFNAIAEDVDAKNAAKVLLLHKANLETAIAAEGKVLDELYAQMGARNAVFCANDVAYERLTTELAEAEQAVNDFIARTDEYSHVNPYYYEYEDEEGVTHSWGDDWGQEIHDAQVAIANDRKNFAEAHATGEGLNANSELDEAAGIVNYFKYYRVEAARQEAEGDRNDANSLLLTVNNKLSEVHYSNEKSELTSRKNELNRKYNNADKYLKWLNGDWYYDYDVDIDGNRYYDEPLEINDYEAEYNKVSAVMEDVAKQLNELYNEASELAKYSIVGDLDMDKSVTVLDYTQLLNIVLGKTEMPEAESILFWVADTNKDGAINVGDLQWIKREIRGIGNSIGGKDKAPRRYNGAAESSDVVTVATEGNKLYIALNNEVQYTSLQMDIKLPGSVTIMDEKVTARAEGLSIASNDVDGMHRVVLHSVEDGSILSNHGAVVVLTLSGDVNAEDVRVENAFGSDAQCRAYALQGVGEATAIENIMNGLNTAKEKVYDLGGRLMNNIQKGVNVIRGKKVVK